MQSPHTEFENTPAAFNMIFVEGGVFEMGSDHREAYDREKPVHTVKVSDFWMGRFPVTQALWNVVMRRPDWVDPAYFKGENRPVENVSYTDIVETFLPRLNAITKRQDYRSAGMIYRLPTEAEWEYAAKGGKYGQKYPFTYAGSNKLDEVGWYDGNSHEETQAVGLKTPNLLGLYDMGGNVWEWCSDWYDAYPDSNRGVIVNPTGPATGSYRVFRGGGWLNYAQRCRSTLRYDYSPEIRDTYVGFRLVLSFSPVQ